MNKDVLSLTGTYEQKIDRRGRLLLPGVFARALGNRLYVTRGLDGCLFILRPSDVTTLCRRLEALPLTLGDARAFTRLMLSGVQCPLDRRKRFVIPEAVRTYAGLGQDVVLLGVLNRVEVWSKDKWTQEIAYMLRQSHTSSPELASRGI